MSDDPSLDELKRLRVITKTLTHVYSGGELEDINRRIIQGHGQVGKCSSCKRRIYWLQFADGKKSPHDEDGTSHFATCSHAAQHRRGG